MTSDLSTAEKRCLRLSFDVSKQMPCYPESINASFQFSRPETIESLHDKGYLLWSSHRGSTYHFTEKARAFVGAPTVSRQESGGAA